MSSISINSTSNCPKFLLRLDKVRAALPLSVHIVGLGAITLQVGNRFLMYRFNWSNSWIICVDVFKTVPFVPLSKTMCYGFSSSNRTRWCFGSSVAVPLKSWTLTTWLLFYSRFTSTPVSIYSQLLNKFLSIMHAWNCLVFHRRCFRWKSFLSFRINSCWPLKSFRIFLTGEDAST